LNYPSSDPVISGATTTLSANVQAQMKMVPSLVNSWQQQDIANSDTGSYFQNPVASGITTINLAANTVISAGNTINCSTNQISTLVSSVYNTSNTIINTTSPAFLYHTNRMSNVVDIGTDMTNPHYKTALGFGKIIMYIVNKTDNVQNNAPMIGSFGSIFAANIISSNANTFLSLSRSYANTITANSYTDPGTGLTTTTYSSNITLVAAQALFDVANNVYNLMNNYRTQDYNFFQNTKSVVNAYNNVSGFNQLGQTEKDLINNNIGTDKIKTRLNS
jgi:hypothetical protein